uniref:hypothetical protein n=1 Tax=Rhodococcus sp. 05-2221-1B TaxID=2022498 RepID=UPI00113FD757|nr:hypothetical protein [Rhodococcus sp. 05-2221-1B]
MTRTPIGLSHWRNAVTSSLSGTASAQANASDGGAPPVAGDRASTRIGRYALMEDFLDSEGLRGVTRKL